MNRFIRVFLLAGFLPLFFSCEKSPDLENEPRLTAQIIEDDLAALDLDFKILDKDHPPQVETTPFRVAYNQALKDLESGNVAGAASSLDTAKTWMDSARPRYYKDHREAILNSRSEETGDDLMEITREFWRLGEAESLRGNKLFFEKYKQAAIEEGELAFLAYKSKGSDVLVIASAMKYQAGCLRDAGEPVKAGKMEERAQSILQSRADSYTSAIMECLQAKNEDCKPDKLKSSYAYFQSVADKVDQLDEKRTEFAKSSGDIFPGKIIFPDISEEKASWKNEYQSYHEEIWRIMLEQAPPTEEELAREAERKRREKINELNKVCEGAEPLSAPGIILEELATNVEDEKVSIRGRLFNGTDKTLYDPKVAICGNIVSEMKSAGFKELKPGMTTGFDLVIFNLTVRDMATKAIPSHKLILMYRDESGGFHKVYRAY